MNNVFINYNIPSYLTHFVGDYWLILFALKVVLCIADWKTLEKANEPGWKQFIPIYDSYLEYKLYWKPSMFWLSLFSPLIIVILYLVGYYSLLMKPIIFIFVFVLIIYFSLFTIILQFKKAKSFNQSFLFGFGLIFFNYIFRLILGFYDKCQYYKKY